MTYRLIIIEEEDRYVLRYCSRLAGGAYITREYEKTADLDQITRQLDEILSQEAVVCQSEKNIG